MSKEYIERETLLEEDFTEMFVDSYDIGVFESLIKQAPAADVIEKEKYDHLLKIARKMHTWIFLNTGDEQSAYDEIGLSDEDNILLGYIGQIKFLEKELE